MSDFNKNSRYCVIGYGSWGTAIAKILLESGNEIAWCVTNSEVRKSLQESRINCKYLTDVRFPKDKTIKLYEDINFAVRESDIIIFAVPSAYLINTLKPLTESLKGKMVISAIKGIVTNNNNELVTITEYFNQVHSVPYDNLGVLTGPCHAEEIAYERLTYINVICKDIERAKAIAERFSCRYMLSRASTDIYGAEYAAVMKNIYAVAVGMCKGLNYGDNFTAVLISNGHREIKRFLKKTYPFERDTTDSAYLGDLLVTSYSQFSRNRTFGMLIGRGYSLTAARFELNNMVSEGYYAANCIHSIAKKKGVELPIADTVYSVLYEKVSVNEAMKSVANRLK